MQQNTRQVQKNAGLLWTPLPSPSSASHEDCRPFHFILSVSHMTPFLKSCCPPNSDSSGLSLYHGLRSRHLHTSVSRYLKRCLSNIDDLFCLPCELFILATNATIHLSERLSRHSFPPDQPASLSDTPPAFRESHALNLFFINVAWVLNTLIFSQDYYSGFLRRFPASNLRWLIRLSKIRSPRLIYNLVSMLFPVPHGEIQFPQDRAAGVI